MRKPRPKFFYGWFVVIASILAGAVQSGGSVWGASVFVSHMTDELGWARSAFFGAFTLRAVVGGVLSPFIGPLQDTRSGPRILMLLTGLTMGFSLMGLKWVDNIVVFYVLFGALGALTMIGGAEMLTVAIVPKWFVRKRGRAVAIASTGTAMGPLFFPFLVHGIITLVGWRDAWMVLGIGSMAIMVPLALMVRSRPEDIGLLPDGATAPEPPPAPGATLDGAQGGLRQAQVERVREAAGPSTGSGRTVDGAELHASGGGAHLRILVACIGLLPLDAGHGGLSRQLDPLLPGHWLLARRRGVGGDSLRGLLHQHPAGLGTGGGAVPGALPPCGAGAADGGEHCPVPEHHKRHHPRDCRGVPRTGAGRLLHHAAAHHRELLWQAEPGRDKRHPAALRHPQRRG